MNTWNIVITDDARNDILEIYNYISETLIAPEAAKGQIRRIMDVIKSLKTMPFRYPLYDNEYSRSLGIRSIAVNNYIVLYVPDDENNNVVIYHVFYSKRNIQTLLTDLY